ncbi:MAG: MFS transporter [Bifidobacteriaceae bacterium]|jgi:MFS family permease|nr:MFS transporter [Bifidobacteriaceae bacterium]
MNTTPNPTYPPPVRLGPLMGRYFGLQLVVNMANGGAATYLLPLWLQELDADSKVAHYGIVGTLAATCAIIAQPLWGGLSDRTRGRWGRRAPWIAAGAGGIGCCIALLGASSIFPLIVAAACGVQICYSMFSAPLTAIVADRTPVERRGVMSALGGAGAYLGVLGGVLVVSMFASRVQLGFLACAAFVVVAGVPLGIGLKRDSRLLPREPKRPVREALQSFWVSPRRYPDFAWVFVARLVLITGFWGIYSFLLYLAQDYCGLSVEEAARVYPLLSAVLMAAILVSIVPGGWISDRLGRRKIVVMVASGLIGASVIVPLLSPTIPALALSLAIAGVGFGAYLSVDQALMTQVLPSVADSGKQLGILNIAQAGGQVLAPGVAAGVIGLVGYRGLYVFAGVMALAAIALVAPIKSVR